MDVKNKQFIGHLLMIVVGGLSALGIYYLYRIDLDAVIIGILVIMLGGFETQAYRWIKYNFQLPEDTPEPDLTNTIILDLNEWEHIQTNTTDGKTEDYYVKKD